MCRTKRWLRSRSGWRGRCDSDGPPDQLAVVVEHDRSNGYVGPGQAGLHPRLAAHVMGTGEQRAGGRAAQDQLVGVLDEVVGPLRVRGGREAAHPGERVEVGQANVQGLAAAHRHPCDRAVIATKFPSYFVRHPAKVTWLIHQYRAAYELADLGLA